MVIKRSYNSKLITTTQIKRKLGSTPWVALQPGEEITFENITIKALSDNSGTVYLGRTPQGLVAKSKAIGNSITVSNY